MKTLFVVGGGHESVYGIRRAQEMGLRICVTDSDANAPGFALADVAYRVSTYNVKDAVAIAELSHQQQRIDGVMSFASDVPVTVAAIAERLKLPGIPVATAKLSADKWLQKQALLRAGIPTPFSIPVESALAAGYVINRFCATIPTWVLKPADSRGARGVSRLASPAADLTTAFETARGYSLGGRVLLEEWIDGPQVSTETVLFADGTAMTPGFLDRNYDRLEQFRPYVIEDGATQPSLLTPARRKLMVAGAERAARALGFYGIAKGDLVAGPNGAVVIEMAARLSGGLMSSVQVPAATGVDLVGVAIRLALGDKVVPAELQPTKHKAVAMRFFLPEPGKIVSTRDEPPVHVKLAAVKIPKVGQIVEPITDHTKRPGYVVTVGDSREQVVLAAERFIRACEVRTTNERSQGTAG